MINDNDSYVPYVPKAYICDGKQVQLVSGTIKDKVRVDGVGTLTGVESQIHLEAENNSDNNQVQIIYIVLIPSFLLRNTSDL